MLYLTELGDVYLPRFDYSKSCRKCSIRHPCYRYQDQICQLYDLTKFNIYAYATYRISINIQNRHVRENKDQKDNIDLTRQNILSIVNDSNKEAFQPFNVDNVLFMPMNHVLFIGTNETHIYFVAFLKYAELLPFPDMKISDLTNVIILDKTALPETRTGLGDKGTGGCDKTVTALTQTSQPRKLGSSNYYLTSERSTAIAYYVGPDKKPDSILDVLKTAWQRVVDIERAVVSLFVNMYEHISKIVLVINLFYRVVYRNYPLLIVLVLASIKIFGLSFASVLLPISLFSWYFIYYSVEFYYL